MCASRPILRVCSKRMAVLSESCGGTLASVCTKGVWNSGGERPEFCDVLERIARIADPEARVWKGSGVCLRQIKAFGCSLACSAARAFAASPLNLRVGGSADGNVARTHEVVHEFRHEGTFMFRATFDGLLLFFHSKKKENIMTITDELPDEMGRSRNKSWHRESPTRTLGARTGGLCGKMFGPREEVRRAFAGFLLFTFFLFTLFCFKFFRFFCVSQFYQCFNVFSLFVFRGCFQGCFPMDFQ